jgi:predicted DNA-binding transcriptional regulator YafY
MPRGNQLTRQWRLLQRLGHSGGLTIVDAAQELGCSVRTVWRDLSVLQDAGFPLFNDPRADGHRDVWQVESSFQHRLPLPLTLPEAIALIVSRQSLSALGPSAFGPAIASVIDKVRVLLGKRALDLIDRMAGAVGVRAPGGKLLEPAAEHLGAIHTAIAQQQSLHLRYYSMSRDAESERRVDPYHVTWFNGGLYLIGHCHLRDGIRIFAVERIRALTTLDDRFTRPADFDADRHLRDAWGLIGGDLVTVKVAFSPAVARYVKERRWHPSQQARDLPGGRLELTLRVADTLEVRRWLMGYGADAEVLAPPTLRESLRREAEAVVRLLGGPQDLAESAYDSATAAANDRTSPPEHLPIRKPPAASEARAFSPSRSTTGRLRRKPA